jgi:undecaprenyl-diphosphatase
MPLYQVVILAVVQGITEFLPISSSAHLALAPWLLGWRDQTLVFDIALHFGTLAAVVIYFWRDWVQIVLQGFGVRFGHDEELARNSKMLWLIAAATVPVGLAGLFFERYAEDVWRHNRFLIGGMLIAVGVLMLVADRVGKRSQGLAKVGWCDAMFIGVAQALSVVPGTSRSGITMVAGLFRDLDRPSAARFSFLIATPAIAAAAAKAFWDLMRHGGVSPEMRMDFLLGILVSAITGSAVIALLLRYLRSHTLKFFVYYRVIFGIMVISLATILRHSAG